MHMREIIDRLNEAAYDGCTTFWFKPDTNVIIPASSHGETVADYPDKFGIPREIIRQVNEAMPYGYEDDEAEDIETPIDLETLPPLPAEIWGSDRGRWMRDDVLEILAMNRGWVRIGLSAGTAFASYMSAERPKSILLAARRFQERLGPRLEAEIVSKRGQSFLSLPRRELDAFLQSTPAQAEAMFKPE